MYRMAQLCQLCRSDRRSCVESDTACCKAFNGPTDMDPIPHCPVSLGRVVLPRVRATIGHRLVTKRYRASRYQAGSHFCLRRSANRYSFDRDSATQARPGADRACSVCFCSASPELHAWPAQVRTTTSALQRRLKSQQPSKSFAPKCANFSQAAGPVLPAKASRIQWTASASASNTQQATAGNTQTSGKALASKQAPKAATKKTPKKTPKSKPSNNTTPDTAQAAQSSTNKPASPAPADPACPKASVTTVAGDADVMLNQTNIGESNNKFYRLQLLEESNADH